MVCGPETNLGWTPLYYQKLMTVYSTYDSNLFEKTFFYNHCFLTLLNMKNCSVHLISNLCFGFQIYALVGLVLLKKKTRITGWVLVKNIDCT
jgi:hypothetical protein